MIAGNFTPPDLPAGRWGAAVLDKSNPAAMKLLVDGRQVMSYTYGTRREAHELVAHFLLGQGHVITTGLGLGIRERWLLTKPSVTKLTVLERSADVIEMHRLHSPWLHDSRVEIIQCDAMTYRGRCDWLLLDHFPDHQTLLSYADHWAISDQIARNISHRAGWMWPLELVLRWGNTGIVEAYDAIKSHSALMLPTIEPEALRNIVAMATMEPLETLP